ncbi:hypothetical protein FEM48_Zijuj02G0100600 [Ziziphus jujuba var. spinosa]|nr:hypothetical protein FEM48_Zijuj02G0100600 [Ziziphus jujuba var. spinosa]
MFASIGSRWSIIAAQLPGRTDNDIKNYWNTKLKKKLMGLVNLPNNSQRKPPPFPSSSHQNQPYPISQPLLSSLYNTSVSSFDPYVSFPSNYYSSNPSLFHTQENFLGGNYSSMQCYYGKDQNSNNVLMFGNEGSCTSSDNGSSNNNHIKQEDMGCSAFQSYNLGNGGFEENENFMLNYGSSSTSTTGCCGYFEETSPLDYVVEDVKQLISNCGTSNNYNNGSNSFFFFNNNNNNNNNNSNINIDENKTQEKVMYFY